MLVLLKKIRSLSPEAAASLEKAGLRTDADLRSLTREDLNELLPGSEKFTLRRTIFDKIHKQRPVNELIRELKAFIPQEHLRVALSDNGVLTEYLHLLKDMRTQMDNIQDFINAHISFLEESSKDQPDQESDKACSLPGRDTSKTTDPMSPHNDQTGDHSQGEQGTSGMCDSMDNYTDQHGGHMRVKPGSSVNRGSFKHLTRASGGHTQGSQTTVIYRSLVTGQTFGAHMQLMDQVKGKCKGQVQFVENSEDYQVTIVFCPIISRVGSDVEAAMNRIKDDKPVILVLMHHAYEQRPTTSVKTWTTGREAVLHVDVFYHETSHGLIACSQNCSAVSSLQNKLLEYVTIRCHDTSGNAHGVGADGGLDRSGGNDMCSNSQSSGGSNKLLSLLWFKN